MGEYIKKGNIKINEIDLMGLLKLFKNNKMPILISVVACVMIAAGYNIISPPRYSSSMDVIVRQSGMNTKELVSNLNNRCNLGESFSDHSVVLKVSEDGGIYTITVTADEPSKARDLCYSVLDSFIQREEEIIKKKIDNNMKQMSLLLPDVHEFNDEKPILKALLLYNVIDENAPVVQVIREPVLQDKTNYLIEKKIIVIAVALGIMLGCSFVIYRKINFSGNIEENGDEV